MSGKTSNYAYNAQEVEHSYIDLKKVIEKYKDKKDSLIQVLHVAQEIYGHLPLDLQQTVASVMNIPLSEVSGVITFYPLFTTKPKGRHIIKVCLGTACYVRGGKTLVDYLEEVLEISVGETTKDGKFTLEIARCIGACGLSPAMMIDNVVYKKVNENKLKSILSKYMD